MADTNFVPTQTVVASAWLNDINKMVYRLLSASPGVGGSVANDKYQVLQNLSTGPTVGNVAQLLTLSKTENTIVSTLGFYTPGDFGHGTYWLNLADTTSADNGITIRVAADGGRWYLLYNGWISALQAGAYNNGSNISVNNAVFASMVALVANGATATIPEFIFPAGTYAYNNGPNWGIQNLILRGMGNCHFQYSGVSNAFVADGTGQPNGGIYDMTIDNITVDAPTTALHGFFIKNVHHGRMSKLKNRGAGASSAGIYVNGCVATLFENPEASPNADGGWYTGAMPQYGIMCDGAVGAQASYCSFINPICEGLAKAVSGAGIYLQGSLGNMFYGGTAEGCTTGITTATLVNGCSHNKIYGMDLEANTVQDIFEQGGYDEYRGIDATNTVTVVSGTTYAVFEGGSYHSINVASGALFTGFDMVTYNRADIAGTGTFSIGDNSTRVRDCVDGKNLIIGPFPQTNIVVGASPFSYTNTYARDVTLAVSGGGAITQLQITRNAVGNLINPATGLVSLSPGDTLQVTYTGGPPSVWLYTK